MQCTLGEILSALDKFSWKQWVYMLREGDISIDTVCMVLDPDEADLGSDNFTPVEVERAGMEEFLSVQDLKSIVQNLDTWQIQAPVSEKCKASVHYFEHDAYMPKPLT